MEKILRVEGKAFCLSPGNNVDTDQIIPGKYMKWLTMSGFGPHVFEDERAKSKGEHPFDLPENKGRTILVVGENFGCGSSREHAVWALVGWPIRAIIGESFAEIFRGNSAPNGLVCVDVAPKFRAKLEEWLRRYGEANVCVNLTEMVVSIGYVDGALGFKYDSCTMPDEHREMLISGQWNTTEALLSVGEETIRKVALSLPYIGQS
uniref:3-isopropylmalate dehydratase n=1 Tax=Candidatus Giovannonibacteria bacterium GW2011_GWF2_42_19 TaxID=1618659 RepID=A0A0G0ZJK9_9BACT|nr:MAG: 3-isopropylmalate dehydratase, small subunit [Candidatus Giovannonibacteria bacterium GW2011_GWF2_42_19]